MKLTKQLFFIILFCSNFIQGTAQNQSRNPIARPPADSIEAPGVYAFRDMVAIRISIYADYTFKIEGYGCLGKFRENDGSWTQRRDTIYLRHNDSITEKYLIKLRGLYQIFHKKDTMFYVNGINQHEFINYRECYRCYEKYDGYNKTKAKYYEIANSDTLLILGYFKNLQVEYISTYNLKNGQPIGTWYYFSDSGNLIKTVRHNEVIKKKKRRRHKFNPLNPNP